MRTALQVLAWLAFLVAYYRDAPVHDVLFWGFTWIALLSVD